jgi:hypothetical protein
MMVVYMIEVLAPVVEEDTTSSRKGPRIESLMDVVFGLHHQRKRKMSKVLLKWIRLQSLKKLLKKH